MMARFILIVVLVVVASFSYSEASECTGGRYDQWKNSRACELTCEKPREPTCHDERQGGCRCVDSTLRRADGRCVARYACFKNAKASVCTGRRYDQWKNSRACELTCKKPREPTCHDERQGGCRCVDLTLRRADRRCVAYDACFKNAEVSECTGGRYDQWKNSRACELTCEKPREPTCHDERQGGCRCVDLTLRRADGRCVARDACSRIGNNRNAFGRCLRCKNGFVRRRSDGNCVPLPYR